MTAGCARTWLCASVALGLAACGQSSSDTRQTSEICSPITTEAGADVLYLNKIEDKPLEKQAWSRRGYMDFCVQKWGYIIGWGNAVDASSAQAVLGACTESLGLLNNAEARYNQEKLSKHDFVSDNYSESTGLIVSREQANYEHYQRQAYFYLAQSHAGRCRVPR